MVKHPAKRDTSAARKSSNRPKWFGQFLKERAFFLSVLGAATGFLATLAACLGNIGQIKDGWEQIWHAPKMSLESTEPWYASSEDQVSGTTLKFRGDPFYRSWLLNLTMTVAPSAGTSGTARLPDNGIYPVKNPERVADAGEELEVPAELPRMPPGAYDIRLKGTVSTSWRSSTLWFDPPLQLIVRPECALRVDWTARWPPSQDQATAWQQDLVQMELIFGKTPADTGQWRVEVDGAWSGHDQAGPLPGGTLEWESVNAPEAAKDVVFTLHNFPSKPFTTQMIRVCLTSPKAMTEAQWHEAVKPRIAPDIE